MTLKIVSPKPVNQMRHILHLLHSWKEPLKGEGVWLQGWFTIPHSTWHKKRPSQRTHPSFQETLAALGSYTILLCLCFLRFRNSHNRFFIFVVVNLRLGAYTNPSYPWNQNEQTTMAMFQIDWSSCPGPRFKGPYFTSSRRLLTDIIYIYII